jgi:hypothetical protein
MPKLSGEDINVSGCTYTAEGETAGEVLRATVEHLKQEHDMDLPDAGLILRNEVEENGLDHGTRLVLKRIRERLQLTDKGADQTGTVPRIPHGGRSGP